MEMLTLTRKRGSMKQKLTNFTNFLLKIKGDINETSISQLEIRVTTLNELLSEYDKVHSEIIVICDEEEVEIHESQREIFEDNFYQMLTESKELITKFRESSNKGSGGATTDEMSNQDALINNQSMNLKSIKLPIIDLPKFSGSFEKWLEFKDSFESLIHNNTSLHSIQKFHYLRSSLSGNAAQVVNSLEFSATNYEIAWQIINDRFNNKRLLINNHVKAIFDLPSIPKESASQIRNLIDSVDLNMRALEILKEPIDKWDTLIIYTISKKLDPRTLREWEQKRGEETPTFGEFKAFLNKRSDLLETLEFNVDLKPKFEKPKRQIGLLSTTAIKCNFCKRDHTIYNCPEFKALEISDKINKVKALNLCFNCLRTNHRVDQCKSKSCFKCKRMHNTLLHIEEESVDRTRVALSSHCSKQILLSTALVQLKAKNGHFITCRALLDNGSQSNFITKACFESLGLRWENIELAIAGIGKTSSRINSQCNIDLRSINKSFTASFSCLILPAICGNLPETTLDPDSIKLPSNLSLADPDFHVPGTIDLLLGCSLFWEILEDKKIELGRDLPRLQSSKLGWILAGSFPDTRVDRIYCGVSVNTELNNQLRRFWEIEESYLTDSETKGVSESSDYCNTHFIENYSRNQEGRFVVRIPFTDKVNRLGSSMIVARNRLTSLEKGFRVNPEFKSKYVEFIREYEAAGHMVKVNTNNDERVTDAVYLPHHGVLKADSITTKLRVVFDGSVATNSGIALNETQMVGPTIQSNLFSILLRLRQHVYVVTADIRQMYRQVLIHPSHRHFQRILWRENETDKIDSYELNTVTYGTASAPYLAIRSLYQLSLDFADSHPISSEIIARDFYVDDLITGHDEFTKLQSICEEVSTILKSGCFHLCKWRSNNLNLLNRLEGGSTSGEVTFGPSVSKTLGILYNSDLDIFSYKGSNGEQTHKVKANRITKRIVLSTVAKTYDPLGFLSPYIILAKILIQRLWSSKLSWDEEVPPDATETWNRFQIELNYLSDLRIPRHVVCKEAVLVEYHGFCDASKDAYGACVYVRSLDAKGNVQVSLLCAKSKVAPLKAQSIPRLELCGAQLLTELMSKVSESLTISNAKRFFWCDSQVALHWVNTSPNILKPFVSNRVSKIQEVTTSKEWYYIPSKDNPADVISRGQLLSKLIYNELYWHGPNRLRNRDEVFVQFKTNDAFVISEQKAKYQTVLATFKPNDLFSRYSTLSKLKRIFAYCLRFINLNKPDRNIGLLTIMELNQSMSHLVKLAQRDSFSNEIELLQKTKQLPSKNKLVNLTPFLDEFGRLRVGGRLQLAELPFNVKHPLLLDAKHPFTRLLFREMHISMLHCGPQHLLASIRQSFWPISGRSLARKITQECLKCHRYSAKSINPIMGSLPKDRVTEVFPFEICGVDYAGPISIKDKKGRGCKVSKCYICLFVCFSTKAIHLEAVTELSSEAFLAALKRFIARRGKPKRVYSDNGTNFVGAHNTLNLLGEFLLKEKDKLTSSFTNEDIEWKFIPPHAPHMGGLWEAGVKSVKRSLKRVISNVNLTYEELATILAQIESSLNSRPLSPLSLNPNDLEPLTPSHFLIGRSSSTLPDRNWQDVSSNKLTRFQLLQRLYQHFWTRWHRDYLCELQQKTRWTTHTENIKLDTLVLVKEDHLPPSKWLLGRIVQLHPGRDGITRVVSIRTQKGIIKRPVAKLSPLPIAEVEKNGVSDLKD